MDHLAVMKPSWKLTSKILSGEKKIESRWYRNKSSPWGKIHELDNVYFKEGQFVSVKGQVQKVLQFENLNQNRVKWILGKYGKEDGIGKDKFNFYFQLFKGKKYCILIFLKNVKKIKPFKINKKGFGSMSGWICLDDIGKIKI